jgi:hypothetical protein
MYARMIIALFSLLAITGCVGSSKQRDESTNLPTVTVNNPPPQIVDTSKIDTKLDKVQSEIRNEIATSTNTTQSHLNGLLNASVSKIAEQFTGMENNVKEMVGIKNELLAQIDLKNELKADINAVATNTMTVDAKLQAMASVVASVEAKVDANISAQAGIGNSIKNIEKTVSNTTTATAGRDNNMLPKEAVTLILGIFTGFFIVVIFGIAWLGKNARDREALNTQEEKANSERWQSVALQAIARLDPASAKEINMTPPPPVGK